MQGMFEKCKNKLWGFFFKFLKMFLFTAEQNKLSIQIDQSLFPV
jgi:hypothetical protein